MQYKVPQNVDIEDQVIGPLTLRQFMIFLIAAGIIFFFYVVFKGYLKIFFWLFSMAIGAGAAALAFAKYGDQTPEIFLASAMKTLTTPRKRVWKKEEYIPVEETEITEKPVEKEIKKKSLEEARDDLSRVAQLVDTGGVLTVEQKDRLIAVEPLLSEDKETPDLLEEASKEGTTVETFIEKESEKAPKREPLVSEMASISPDQKFDYVKVKTK